MAGTVATGLGVGDLLLAFPPDLGPVAAGLSPVPLAGLAILLLGRRRRIRIARSDEALLHRIVEASALSEIQLLRTDRGTSSSRGTLDR